MPETNFDDKFIEQLIRDIIRYENDPSTWGETIWQGEIDLFSIWEWAESQDRTDLMSVIATNVIGRVLTETRFLSEKENALQFWSSKIEHLAKEAQEDKKTELEARFLEAWLYSSQPGDKTLEVIDRVISLYRQLNRVEKTAYFLCQRSTELNSLLVRGKLQSDEHEIWKSLIEAYTLSKSVNYYKGIALALFGLGHYLGRKHKDNLALRLLHQADWYSKKARTVYGIAIIEELRKIRDRSDISNESYQLETDPDLLIEEFIKEIMR